MTKPYIKILNILLLLIFSVSFLKSQQADTISSNSFHFKKIINEANDDSLNKDNEPIITGADPRAVADFKNFSELHISYYGTTQNCKAFNIHCFKYKRTWFLIANQEMNITFFTLRPPRLESVKIVSGSDFLLMGLGKTYANQYTKLKKRRKVIKDLEIYGFYKFNKPGKKSIKGLLYLEYPQVDPGPPWPFKWVGEKAAEKAAEKAKQVQGIIPEINTEPLEPLKEAAPK